MQQLTSVWSALSMQRRVIVGLATLAMFALILGLSRMAAAPSMTLLYSGLEDAAAGEVVTALEQRGAVYEVRGSAIFVEEGQRDRLRMSLAGEGLPANGPQGYELLDSLSGFGTTSQMFDAAYWRAKEGELARTIVASGSIRNARVHIATDGTSPFRGRTEPTASVTVTPAGDSLSAERAKALRYLVSSAVAGLSAANVSVIDGRNGVVLGDEDGLQTSAADRAERIRQNISRLIEARVGPGNAVVEVNLETVTEREEIFERRFDPEGRVAISNEVQENTTSSNESDEGVTVASNLPDGDAEQNGTTTTSQESQTRERTNYEVDETRREVLRVPGDIRRVSVAVLVNGLSTTNAEGEPSWQPRGEEELADLRELVASAMGYSDARGDSLTIKSMQFPEPSAEGTMVTSSLGERFTIDAMGLIQLAVLALVVLALGLFVVRPILANRRAASEIDALEGPDDIGMEALDAFAPDADDAMLPVPAVETMASSDTVARLRRLMEERQDETVGVLRKWMEDRGEKA